MSDVDEIKSPFLRKNIEERGIIDDLVTDLLIVERYLRRPELTDAVAALMLRAAIKDHPLEVEIVSRELSSGRAITEPEMDELRDSLMHSLAGQQRPNTTIRPGVCINVPHLTSYSPRCRQDGV